MIIYLCEDDENIREMVSYTLRSQGYDVESFDRPSTLFERIDAQIPDLLLLDIMLPETDGLSVLGSLKKNIKTKNILVMMLTAKGSEYDKVVGLDSGADDYMTKPFGIMELIARVKALLRRCQKNEELTFSNLTLKVGERKVSLSGEDVPFTKKEFELLQTLMESPDMVFSREELLGKVWGYDFDGENRTVDVHIRSLRTKLGELEKQIETVRGYGYMFSSKIKE